MQHLTYRDNMVCYGTHCETKGNVVSYVWMIGLLALFALPILFMALM